MDRMAAKDFARHWEASWRKVDIDAVVSHLADDAEMRSPLAVTLTGSAVVKGAPEIRSYWQKAYGHIQQADIRVLAGTTSCRVSPSGGSSTMSAPASSWISVRMIA